MKKAVKKQYKKAKFKIIASTWNDKFELSDDFYSVSDIQDYIEYIIKKHETLTTITHIYVYINRMNNALLFEIKDRYDIELQTSKTMKLLGSTKKVNRRKKT